MVESQSPPQELEVGLRSEQKEIFIFSKKHNNSGFEIPVKQSSPNLLTLVLCKDLICFSSSCLLDMTAIFQHRFYLVRQHETWLVRIAKTNTKPCWQGLPRLTQNPIGKVCQNTGIINPGNQLKSTKNQVKTEPILNEFTRVSVILG